MIDPQRKKNIEMILKILKKSNDQICTDVFQCSRMTEDYIDTLINALPRPEEIKAVNNVKEKDKLRK